MERLEDDVVRAGIEGFDAVVERGPLGEREDGHHRRPVVGAQVAHELQRIDARRGEGQDQEVGLVLVDRAEAVLAISKGDDAVSRTSQDPRQTHVERPSHPR